MNKNTIIGAILIAAIMIWWMSMSSANSKALAEAKAKEKAAAEVVVKDASKTPELVLPAAEGAAATEVAPVLGEASAIADSAAAGAAADSASVASDSAASMNAPVIEPRTITVETEKFIMTLSNKGAKIQSVVVKALADSAGNFPELIQDTTLGALDLKLGKADLSQVLFDAGDAPAKIVVDADTTVQFVFKDANGNQVVRSYGFTKLLLVATDSYL